MLTKGLLRPRCLAHCFLPATLLHSVIVHFFYVKETPTKMQRDLFETQEVAFRVLFRRDHLLFLVVFEPFTEALDVVPFLFRAS